MMNWRSCKVTFIDHLRALNLNSAMTTDHVWTCCYLCNNSLIPWKRDTVLSQFGVPWAQHCGQRLGFFCVPPKTFLPPGQMFHSVCHISSQHGSSSKYMDSFDIMKGTDTHSICISHTAELFGPETLSIVYRICLQCTPCTQLTKTSGLKRPVLDLSLTALSCSRICYQRIINTTMNLNSIINLDTLAYIWEHLCTSVYKFIQC